MNPFEDKSDKPVSGNYLGSRLLSLYADVPSLTSFHPPLSPHLLQNGRREDGSAFHPVRHIWRSLFMAFHRMFGNSSTK
jgi:hypothetical protein